MATHPLPYSGLFSNRPACGRTSFLRMDWCNTLRGVFQVHVCVRCRTTRSRIRVTLPDTDWVHRDRRVSTADALNVLPSDTACPRRLHNFFHTDKTSFVILCFVSVCAREMSCASAACIFGGRGRKGRKGGSLPMKASENGTRLHHSFRGAMSRD